MWGQRGRTVKDHHANITPAPPNPSLDGLPRVRAIKTNYDTTNEANHLAIPADRLPSLSAPLRQGFTGLRVEVYTTPGVLPYLGRPTQPNPNPPCGSRVSVPTQPKPRQPGTQHPTSKTRTLTLTTME